MSMFDADFAAVDDVFAEVFGADSIMVTEIDGTEHIYAATALDEQTEERQTEYGLELVVTREFSLEITSDVAERARLVTLDTTPYAVEAYVLSTSGSAILKTKRIGAVEQSRDTYRRRNP